jgi:hypothetical protein
MNATLDHWWLVVVVPIVIGAVGWFALWLAIGRED